MCLGEAPKSLPVVVMFWVKTFISVPPPQEGTLSTCNQKEELMSFVLMCLSVCVCVVMEVVRKNK